MVLIDIIYFIFVCGDFGLTVTIMLLFISIPLVNWQNSEQYVSPTLFN